LFICSLAAGGKLSGDRQLCQQVRASEYFAEWLLFQPRFDLTPIGSPDFTVDSANWRNPTFLRFLKLSLNLVFYFADFVLEWTRRKTLERSRSVSRTAQGSGIDGRSSGAWFPPPGASGLLQ